LERDFRKIIRIRLTSRKEKHLVLLAADSPQRRRNCERTKQLKGKML
jgi:hypothetical protein